MILFMCVCVCVRACASAASEEVVCAPDMLRARVFPDNGSTWQKECKTNENITRKMTGTPGDDEWWAKRTREYVESELRAELINCMESYAKETGFRAPGSQVRKKRRTQRSRDDPANLSSGDEAEEEEEEAQAPAASNAMNVDECGDTVLDGGYGKLPLAMHGCVRIAWKICYGSVHGC